MLTVALLAEGVDRNINEAVNRYLAEVALLAEGVDRNYAGMMENHGTGRSPSSRRAWIEIAHQCQRNRLPLVALLAEGVDRNYTVEAEQTGATVALLAEGVDRNIMSARSLLHELVALLAEGVDRNRSLTRREQRQEASPSSRRAWIEIRRACR